MTGITLPQAPLVDGPTTLRRWRDTDVSAIVAACQDPDIARWTSVPSPYTEAHAREYMLARHSAIATATAAPFAIVSSTDEDRLIGSIALIRFAWRHARGEVGYWLAPEGRGAGHATRAVKLICHWGFDQLGLERIDLYAATGNPVSQRVAERAGFTREAVLRSFMSGKDERHDMVAFGLLAGDSQTSA